MAADRERSERDIEEHLRSVEDQLQELEEDRAKLQVQVMCEVAYCTDGLWRL